MRMLEEWKRTLPYRLFFSQKRFLRFRNRRIFTTTRPQKNSNDRSRFVETTYFRESSFQTDRLSHGGPLESPSETLEKISKEERAKPSCNQKQTAFRRLYISTNNRHRLLYLIAQLALHLSAGVQFSCIYLDLEVIERRHL